MRLAVIHKLPPSGSILCVLATLRLFQPCRQQAGGWWKRAGAIQLRAGLTLHAKLRGRGLRAAVALVS